MICESGYALMRFQGKVLFLFWLCALFAPAPCPFKILAGALYSYVCGSMVDRWMLLKVGRCKQISIILFLVVW